MQDIPPKPRPVAPALSPRRSRYRSWGHVRTISALMLREMASRYGRSPGGYIWAVLEPLAMILVLSVGFQLLFRNPSLGSSFILFYATGFLPYNLFAKTSRTVMHSINYSRALLSYPAVSWIDAISARAILNTLTETLVACILLLGVLTLVDTKTVLEYDAILLAFVLAALLGIGVGMINCVFIAFVPIWETVWNIIMRPLFLASGILWIYKDLPQVAREILFYNPLLHITAKAREGFYPMYDPTFVSVPALFILVLVLITFGLLLMSRYHREVMARR